MLEIIKLDNQLDDRVYNSGEKSISNPGYALSFCRLEDTIKNINSRKTYIPQEILVKRSDPLGIKLIMQILRIKIEKLKEEDTISEIQFNIFQTKLLKISELHRHDANKLFFTRHEDIGYNLYWWLSIFYAINPPAIKYARTSEEYFKIARNQIYSNSQINSIRNFIFGDNENKLTVDEIKISEKSIRFSLRRVYEGLRALIGTTQSYRELIGRYKARAMWYDKERLNALPKKGKIESPLVLDLARWLFDQGLPVLVEPKFDNERFDLLGIKVPIIIEGKAYKAATSDILKNLAQLHSYLTSLDSTDFHISEGFYVIFRLSGPMYQFEDEVIDTGRYRIFPFVINLGDGGRKISKVITISKKEVIEAFNATPETTDSENSVTDS